MERRPAKKKADDGNVIKGDWSGWVSCQLIPRLLYECTQELIVLSRQIGANLICSGLKLPLYRGNNTLTLES